MNRDGLVNADEKKRERKREKEACRFFRPKAGGAPEWAAMALL